MNYSLIDIGSNSIRLTVYEINGTEFKPLFHSKIMAGLAGYVENGKLSHDGIDAAKSALLELKQTLTSLSINDISVFATASLRNITNTKKVVKKLTEATGYEIEIINNKEEALLSFYGAKLELPQFSEGAFTDIGGASTEIISFENKKPSHIISYKMGSLNLYKKCVKKILPGEDGLKSISNTITKELIRSDFPFTPHSPLICVGGTARAVMKIGRKLFHLPETSNKLSSAQVDEIYHLLSTNKKKSSRLILRLAPDRIHTIVPGLSILVHIMHLYHSKEIIVSNYGIREGFLCKKIIQSNKTITSSLKTGN